LQIDATLTLPRLLYELKAAIISSALQERQRLTTLVSAILTSMTGFVVRGRSVLTHCLALFFGVGRALCVLALGLVEVVAAQALDVVYRAQKNPPVAHR
jgi:hypothetical protein